jgi:catalase
MRVDDNYGSHKAYEPNGLGLWQQCPEAKEPPLRLDGTADNWDDREDDDDYYTQPGMLFRIMSPEQQQVLFSNTAAELDSVDDQVRKRHIRNCLKADPAYGKGVADAMGIPLDDLADNLLVLECLCRRIHFGWAGVGNDRNSTSKPGNSL